MSVRAFYSFFFFIIISSTSFAQWNYDTSTGGKMVIQLKDLTRSSYAFTDNNGGTIQVFERLDTEPFPSDPSIYVQHTDSSGNLLWGNANTATAFNGDLFYSPIAKLLDAKSDNAGGAYILYHSLISSSGGTDFFGLFLQHINKDGSATWPGKGVNFLSAPVSGDTLYYPNAKIAIGDDASAFVVYRNGTKGSGPVYTQKVLKTGIKAWAENGIQISSIFGVNFLITPDNSGGLITVFEDGRNAGYDSFDYKWTLLEIYGQHISNSGSKLWGADGMIATGSGDDNMFLTPENETSQDIIADGAGGCYFAYGSNPGDKNGPVSLQRLTGDGQKPWGAFGIIGSNLDEESILYKYKIYKNPGGGIAALYFASEASVEDEINIWLQYFNPDGSHVYPSEKKVTSKGFASLLNLNYSFDACFQKDSSALLFFIGNGLAQIPRLQKIKIDGSLSWDSKGKIIVSQTAARVQVIQDNNSGFATLQWFDTRNYPIPPIPYLPTTNDVFITRVNRSGEFPTSRRIIYSIKNGNWNSAATWEFNTIPGPDDIVIVLHNVAVNVNASCYSLSLQSTGSIIAMTGFTLSILH